jgi:threonine dehydratase
MLKILDTTAEDLKKVHERIKPYVHRTPIFTSSSIDNLAGCTIYFKCENFQKVGAYKPRGAANAILSLPESVRKKGVATHSSGNHAQAMAYIAGQLGVPAFIVMPENATKVKREAVLGYGATVIDCESTMAAREATLKKVAEEKDLSFIPPYDHPDVVLGQATVSMEVFEEGISPDFFIIPTGGGGLLSGTAIATKIFSPQTKVIGAEPEGADDSYQSFKQGVRIVAQNPQTIADGLRTSIGKLNFEIITKIVDDICLVSDAEIIEAQKIIMQRMKLVIEPSAAVPLALILKDKARFEGKKVAVVLSGGNFDFDLGKA